MFVHLTKRTKFPVRVRLFNKRTNTNELPAERFTNCSPNVWFVCSPSPHTSTYILILQTQTDCKPIYRTIRNNRMCRISSL
ncbi:hypothetical protein HanPI659440_Chr09g0360821 [Helianthus annuus]|nr:hypothetical protein HanPI659440_Chr09g0360821 [Helianthus annuus]